MCATSALWSAEMLWQSITSQGFLSSSFFEGLGDQYPFLHEQCADSRSSAQEAVSVSRRDTEKSTGSLFNDVDARLTRTAAAAASASTTVLSSFGTDSAGVVALTYKVCKILQIEHDLNLYALKCVSLCIQTPRRSVHPCMPLPHLMQIRPSC